MKREEIRVRVVKGGNVRHLTLKTALANKKRGWIIEDTNFDANGNPIDRETKEVVEKVVEIVNSVQESAEVSKKTLGGIKRTKSIDKLKERLETESNEEIREAINQRITELENE